MEALLQTREAWLNYVAHRLAPMFERLGAPLPAQVRIAIGFTSSGRRSRHIGECWDNQCSEDRHFEIFIRPDLSESKELMPMQVAAGALESWEVVRRTPHHLSRGGCCPLSGRSRSGLTKVGAIEEAIAFKHGYENA
jgi:hypothetical protein